MLVHASAADGDVSEQARKLSSAAQLAGLAAVAVVPPEDFFAPGGLASLLQEGGGGVEGVAGVLLEATSDAQSAYSPAPQAPQAGLHHAGQSAEYAWNPAGSGASSGRFALPVVQMSADQTAYALRRAAWNDEERAFKRPVFEGRLQSDARTDGTAGTAQALKKAACVPVGGHGVVAVIGGAGAAEQGGKPTVLVAATLDARSFFYYETATGAAVARSGVATVLAAAEALSGACTAAGDAGCAAGSALGGGRVAFAALDAEAWGHVGARSLGRALRGQAGTPQLPGALAQADVAALLEVGPVGTSQAPGGELYAHRAGPGTSAVAAVLGAMGARNSTAPAEAGLPPGAAMAMAHDDDAHWLPRSVVLSGWDTRLPDNYMSQRDILAAYNSSALKELVARAATAVARGACAAAQATGSGNASAARVECGAIEASPMHASALVDCLVAERPGLNCDLAKARIWAGSSATADRYSGQQERPSASPGAIRRAHALVFDLLATAVDAGADGVQVGCNWTDTSGRQLQAQGNSTCPSGMMCASATTCTNNDGVLTCMGGHCVDSSAGFWSAMPGGLAWDTKQRAWQVNASAVTGDEELFCETYWTGGDEDPFKFRATLAARSPITALLCGFGVTLAATLAAMFLPAALKSRAACVIVRRLSML